MKKTKAHDIITVRASAGGVETLVGLARRLPADRPASIFVVRLRSADRFVAPAEPTGTDDSPAVEGGPG
jgi:chemotaxis response regulator CheB